MKKAWMMLFLVALLLITVSAQADTRTSGLYTYEIKGNGTITITGFDWAQNDADIYIPNMIDGYTVTGIADEAFRCESQQKTSYSVTLPESITSIGSNAFWNANISAINIPDSVQVIGYGAFVGCNDCQFKVSPSHSAFAVIDNALYNKAQKELIAYYSSTAITIPEGIQSIGDYAIYATYKNSDDENARSHFSLTLPSTLKKIGAYAFYNLHFDYGFGLPGMLAEIGDYAFACASFSYGASIIIPSSIERIGKGAFSDVVIASGEITINKSSSFHRIEDSAFQGTRNIKIVVNAQIDYIGSNAFSESRSVPWQKSTVIIDISHLKELGEYAFYQSDGTTYSGTCDNLSSEIKVIPAGFNMTGTLPNTITEISSNAYSYIVTNFYLPSSITKMASDAFPKGSTFVVEAGSYAELWASENGFGYSIEGQNNLDWLNN